MSIREQCFVEGKVAQGVGEIDFVGWHAFATFMTSEFAEFAAYVFRGQSNSDWLLEPSLDRAFKKLPVEQREKEAFRHLTSFIRAVRGRRGSNPPKIETDDDWWSLGQPYGLHTPLLDWSRSPFVAAFFALCQDQPLPSEKVAIYALYIPGVVEATRELNVDYESTSGQRPPGLHFISPFVEDNPRLLHQSGLFTRGPVGVDIER